MFRSLVKKMVLSLSILSSTFAFGRQTAVLTSHNTVVLRGVVNGESVAQTMQKIMSNPNKKIYLFISSPGGSIVDGLHLVTLLRTTNKDVTCITNFSASMAFVIMQSCKHRLVTDDGVMMQHVASYGLNEGPLPNNHSMVGFIEAMVKSMDVMQAKRLGISYTDFKAKTRDDWWLYGKASVRNHTADDVVSVSCSNELVNKTTTERKSVLFWTFDVTWSNCPLIGSPLKVTPVKSLFAPVKVINKKSEVSSIPAVQREYVKEFRYLQKELNWRQNILAGSHG